MKLLNPMKAGLVLGLILSLAAPAAFAGDNLNMVVIVKGTTSPYWQFVDDGAKAAAKKFGVHLTLSGPPVETDIAKEISMLESAIAKQPDAIIVAPTAYKPLSPAIKKASHDGIPVIVMDSAASTHQYAAFVATNNVQAGKLAGQQFIRFLKKKHGKAAGDIAYLTSTPGVGSLQQRDKGFLDVIKQHPGIHVVAHRYGKDDPAQALQETNNLLTAHPNLVGVFADNEIMADGAGKAFESDKSTRSKVLVAFDSDNKILSYVKKGVIDATVVQDPFMIGFDGVAYGVLAHYGAKLPAFTNTGAKAVTKANIGSASLQGYLHPQKRTLTPYVGPSK